MFLFGEVRRSADLSFVLFFNNCVVSSPFSPISNRISPPVNHCGNIFSGLFMANPIMPLALFMALMIGRAPFVFISSAYRASIID